MVYHWLHTVFSSQRILLLVVLVGLIAAGFYTLVWHPTTDKIQMLEKNILEIQQEINVHKTHRSEFQQTDARIQKVEAIEFSHHKMESSVIRPHVFRDDVMKVVDRYGVLLTLWEPSRRASKEESPIEKARIHGRFEGDYHQIAQSFAMILQLPWVREIKQIRIHMVDLIANEEKLLVTDFQLITFSDSYVVKWPHSSQPQVNGI
ncbi:MAG: hypothetical protein ACPGYT_10890 [Nitrospirales bacterium]